MKTGVSALNVRTVILMLGLLAGFNVVAQIHEAVTAVNFGLFNITSALKPVNGNYVLYVTIFKGNTFIFTDSVVTNVSLCQGFSVPANQPFKDYLIFSKHTKGGGKTYIMNRQGDFAMIAGGTFWAAPKNKLLFVLAEKEYPTLVVFGLQQMKTVFEKYSCDKFTDWYYLHGKYFGKVETDCGDDLKPEKEVSEWMHPVEIEQFDVKLNALNEMHMTDEQVEHAAVLIKYAACK
jgi:hypothetical protein